MTHKGTMLEWNVFKRGNFVQRSDKKPGSIVEIVALLLLVSISLVIPRQENIFKKDQIAEGALKSASYLNEVESSSLLMTSDKVVLPESWTYSAMDNDGIDLRVLKLRSKQVRFVQTTDSESMASANLRILAAENNDDVWEIESVKRLGLNGQVETLSVADIDGERTTPFVELGNGANDFSVVYHSKKNHNHVQRKKIRLVTASEI